MKKILLILVVAILLGCATANINRVQDKWGPPAKTEQNGDLTTYFYYFNKNKSNTLAYLPGEGGGILLGQGSTTSGWICVEFICDKEGNIIKKRQYWAQPEMK